MLSRASGSTRPGAAARSPVCCGREGTGTPAASTVTGILRRNGVELGAHGGGVQPLHPLRARSPNDLWQMDFKGHVALRQAAAASADRARRPFALLRWCWRLAPNETTETVKPRLIAAFRRYGLPGASPPTTVRPGATAAATTSRALGVWLIEHGVAIGHSRPCHPQTLGKDERFHRSLKAEALAGAALRKPVERRSTPSMPGANLYNARRPARRARAARAARSLPALAVAPSARPSQPFEYAPGDDRPQGPAARPQSPCAATRLQDLQGLRREKPSPSRPTEQGRRLRRLLQTSENRNQSTSTAISR